MTIAAATTETDDLYRCGGSAGDYRAWIDLLKECKIEMPISDPSWCLDHSTASTGFSVGNSYPTDWLHSTPFTMFLDYEPAEFGSQASGEAIGPLAETFTTSSSCTEATFDACFKPNNCLDNNYDASTTPKTELVDGEGDGCDAYQTLEKGGKGKTCFGSASGFSPDE
jgi:hypothetical protein